MTCLALHPRRHLIAVAHGMFAEVRDLDSGKVLATLPTPIRINDLTWNPDGETLGVACMNERIYLWNFESTMPPFILDGLANGASALMLGDRGLVSFTHLAMLMGQGIQGCFRLPRGQAVFGRGRTSRRKIKPLGRQDLLVRWRASQRPKWLSKKRWAALAKQELVLRQIAFRVRRRGFRTQWAWIVTTLTDPKAYPAQDLIDLYGKRWQIEVYFRDLKRTPDMSLISARTPEGARKEILAFVLLYNLIRGVMKEAARRQGTEPERISFVDALRWLLWSEPGAALADLVVNPIRVRNAPPRRVKVARHRFPQLNAPRQQLCKPPCQAML